ncbi:MAG: YhdP family protein [Betaproteobacteria bacterium]
MVPSRSLRLIRFAGSAIIAAVVVFCALLLVLRFAIFPRIGDYRDRIAAEIGAVLGQPVTIGAITAGWDGWNPRLGIDNFAIHDVGTPGGAPALLLPRVDVVVAWTSIPVWDLRLKELAVERPQLAIRRGVTGKLYVAGLEVDTTTAGSDSRVTRWLLQQRQIIVHDAGVTWIDELRTAPPLVLNHVTLRLEKLFGRHEFGLVAEPPPELASQVDVRGEFTASTVHDWRAAKGKLYLRVDYVDLAPWRAWISQLQAVETGKGAMRLWFEFAGGHATDAVADVELSDVRTRLAKDLPQLDLTTLGGRLLWKRSAGARELGARGLTFQTRAGQALAPINLNIAVTDSPDGAVIGGHLDVDRLEVAPLAALATHLPFPAAWRRDVAMLALKGGIADAKYAWKGPVEEPVEYTGSGTFSQFSIAANANAPGASGVSGSFTFDQASGDLRLDSRDMRVVLPRVFAESLLFNTAAGRVRWSRDDGGWRFAFDDVRFATPHTSGNASGTWRSQGDGPGIIDLKAGLAKAEAQNLYRYLPLTLDTHLRDWLRSAIKEGTATDIKLVLAGDLGKVPFADAKRGQLHASFNVADATLDYAQGWPALTGIDATVRFDGAGLSVDGRSAKLFGATVGPLTMAIPNLGAQFPMLTLVGNAAGPTTEFLHFIDKSPVAAAIGHFTDGARVTGDGKLALRLDIPLGMVGGNTAVGEFSFKGNSLVLPDIPHLTDVGGAITFTEHSVRSRDLVATTVGGPSRIDLHSDDGGVHVHATGTAQITALQTEMPLPLMQRLSGAVEWTLQSTTLAQATSWTLESNLRGVAINVPAPVGKDAATPAMFRVERRPVPGKTDVDLMSVDYDGALRVLLQRTQKGDTTSVDRALVLLGKAVNAGGAPDRAGIWVRGQIADLDLDEWLALYGKERARYAATPQGAAAAPVPPLRGVEIETRRIDIFGRVLRDLNVSALRGAGEDWRLRLQGRELEGTAIWGGPIPAAPNGKLTARLTRFVPPDPDELHPAHSEIAADEQARNTWPQLDIVADTFVKRGHDLGRFELQAQPSGTDWRVATMTLANSAGRLDTNGWWRIGRDKQTTEMDVHLTAEDAGKFLERMGYPVAVINAPTKINGKLAWNGAPNDFDYPTLTGSFSLVSGAGQFTKIDPGIGKLLGVLSLQALPRRITLDFRDVFSEGFAFDDITGDFEVQRGQMRTDNLRLAGPAASVKITGDIDLARETQNLNVRVLPSLASSVSAGAAVLFIANPLLGAVVGAGTFLAQKMFDDPIEKLFSYDYLVSGAWSDPQVERAGRRELPPLSGIGGEGAAR